MSCKICGVSFSSTIEAIRHLNRGCEPITKEQVKQDTKKTNKCRDSCQQCGTKYEDTTVLTRLNHKCPIKEEIVPVVPDIANISKKGKPLNECQYCHKTFIKIDRHYQNCAKNPKKVIETKVEKVAESKVETGIKMWHCDICNVDLKYFQQFKHQETKAHLDLEKKRSSKK